MFTIECLRKIMVFLVLNKETPICPMIYYLAGKQSCKPSIISFNTFGWIQVDCLKLNWVQSTIITKPFTWAASLSISFSSERSIAR